jgi:hypothetical protein
MWFRIRLLLIRICIPLSKSSRSDPKYNTLCRNMIVKRVPGRFLMAFLNIPYDTFQRKISFSTGTSIGVPVPYLILMIKIMKLLLIMVFISFYI